MSYSIGVAFLNWDWIGLDWLRFGPIRRFFRDVARKARYVYHSYLVDAVCCIYCIYHEWGKCEQRPAIDRKEND